MKTTMIIVEFLIGGILILIALSFCFASFFPGTVHDFSDYFNRFQSSFDEDTFLFAGALLSTVFVAIAYEVGILLEFIGLHTFEWRHDVVKKNRMRKFLRKLEEDNVNLGKSPILRKFKGVPPDRITKKQARSCIGPMRFYVLNESPSLYQDIESQLHRLRLIRFLFFVEVLLFLAVFRQLVREPSCLLKILLIFFGGSAYLNYRAIVDRFGRYCRAVERSYRTLVFDRDQYTNAAISPQTLQKMKIKRLNTEEAHQEYQNPLVGIIVLLFRGKEIAVFRQGSTCILPEKYARGDEWLKESVSRTLSSYVKCQQIKIESCVLLSGGDYRKNTYQFNYVVFVKMEESFKLIKQTEFISKANLGNIRINPDHKKLLHKYFENSCLQDEIIVPINPSIRLEPKDLKSKDKKRLEKTKEIHAANFPMPSITVDGLLLKFSENFEFQGIILERRSKKIDREPGKWAFPAGFVCAYEKVSEALVYEVYEEIGITLKENQFLSVFKHGTGPYRDPKQFAWTQFLVAYTMEEPCVKGESEIDKVEVFLPHKIPYNEMAFDHGDILREFVDSISQYIESVERKENECKP